MAFRRGPRILPLVLIALAVSLLLPGGGFVFFAFLKVMLAFWLVMCLMGIFAAARFRRHVRRYSQSGPAVRGTTTVGGSRGKRRGRTPAPFPPKAVMTASQAVERLRAKSAWSRNFWILPDGVSGNSSTKTQCSGVL